MANAGARVVGSGQPVHPEGVEHEGRGRRLLRRLDALQRRHGSLAFSYAVVKKFGEDTAGQLAALVAYYGFFSLFPLLMVLFTVLGWALHGNPDLQRSVVDSTLAQFPVIGDELRENVGSVRGNGVALVIGVVGALWAGLGALQAGENAMNSVWDVPIKDRPHFVESRLRALLMLVVLGAGVLATTLAGSAATFSEGLGVGASVVGFLVSAALATGLFVLAFRVLTDRDLSWSQVRLGAAVGGVAWAVLQAVGGWYLGHQLKGSTQTYGLFGLVLGLLSWLYLQAQVFVVAAEINVVRERRLWPRSLTGDDLTDADRRALRQHADVEERIEEEHVDVAISSGGAPARD